MLNLPPPQGVDRVAVIGTGVIGSGWVAHFLRLGMEVAAYDPAPDAEANLRATLSRTWPTLERLGLARDASPDRMRFAPDLPSAVKGAQVVQENTPEHESRKKAVIEAIDAHAPPTTVVVSSTSGIPMTALQAGCRHPERCIVGHPFNPPYLIPLVEVVPGERTAQETTTWTAAFYTAVGKRPLVLSREYPAFLANRLLEAVWREALHLVNDGLATVEEIDLAMTYAPALRWAVMGPFMTYHLAGGDGGMEHFLNHFGPSLDLPWSYMDAPELTPDLRQRVMEGCARLAAGRSVQELAQERDACLLALLETLRSCRPE